MLVLSNSCSRRNFFCDIDGDPYYEIMIYEVHSFYVHQTVYTSFNGCESLVKHVTRFYVKNLLTIAKHP